MAASLGGLLAVSFFGSAGGSAVPVPTEADATIPTRSRWLPPTIAGLVSLILCSMVATIRSGDGATLWASLTFALTCAFIGLAILGATLARGRRRAIWLGAALFGAGYTALVFGRPVGHSPRTHLATDPILKGLRAQIAPVAKGLRGPSARILVALDRPIPMRFPDETPLAYVLEYVKHETSTPTGPGIPIYVDPIGLQEAERSMNSMVQIDLEGVPLRTTLGLCLEQLGLAYEVENGYLRIVSEDSSGNRSPGVEDPDTIVGHCLLTLLAAGFGAVAATIVAGPRAGPIRPE